LVLFTNVLKVFRYGVCILNRTVHSKQAQLVHCSVRYTVYTEQCPAGSLHVRDQHSATALYNYFIVTDDGLISPETCRR